MDIWYELQDIVITIIPRKICSLFWASVDCIIDALGSECHRCNHFRSVDNRIYKRKLFEDANLWVYSKLPSSCISQWLTFVGFARAAFNFVFVDYTCQCETRSGLAQYVCNFLSGLFPSFVQGIYMVVDSITYRLIYLVALWFLHSPLWALYFSLATIITFRRDPLLWIFVGILDSMTGSFFLSHTVSEQLLLNWSMEFLPSAQFIFGVWEAFHKIHYGGEPALTRIAPLIFHCLAALIPARFRIDAHLLYNVVAYNAQALSVPVLASFTGLTVFGVTSCFAYFLAEPVIFKLVNKSVDTIVISKARKIFVPIKYTYFQIRRIQTRAYIEALSLSWRIRDLRFRSSFPMIAGPMATFAAMATSIANYEMMSLIKISALFIHHLSLCSTYLNITIVVGDFVDRIMQLYKFRYTDLYGLIIAYLDDFFGYIPESGFTAVKSVLRTMTTTLNCKAIKVISDLVIFVTLAPMLKSRGLNLNLRNYSLYAKRNFRERTEREGEVGLFLQVAEGVVDMLESGYLFVSGEQSFVEFLHCGSSYGNWYDVYLEIMKERDILTIDYDPLSPLVDTIPKLNLKVTKFLMRGSEIAARAAANRDRAWRDISRMIQDVEGVRKRLKQLMSANRSRLTPLGVLAYGEPNCGKSRVIDIVKRAYMDHAGLDHEQATLLTFNHNSADPYMTNLTPGHKIFIEDDICAVNPDSGKQDQSLDVVLNLISSLPYFPNMAALEDKGTVAANPDIVIATTNKKDLNARSWFVNAAAFLRRFPIVILPKVHKDFVYKEGALYSNSIDSSKLVEFDEKIHGHLIKYLVQRPMLKPNTIAKVEYEDFFEEPITETQLYKFLREKISDHVREQQKYIDKNNFILTCGMCQRCDLPQSFCECPITPESILSMREAMRSAGRRASAHKTALYGFGAIISAITATLLVIKGVNMLTSDDTTSIQEEMATVENAPWEPPPATQDPLHIPTKSMQASHLRTILASNTYRGVCEDGSDVHLLGVEANYFLTVSHAFATLFENDKSVVKFTMSSLSTRKARLKRGAIVQISSSQVRRYRDDLLIVFIPNIPPVRKITPYFIDDIHNIKSHAGYNPVLGNVIYVDNVLEAKSGVDNIARNVIPTNKPGKVGVCGTPYSVENKGKASIIGIHVGSNGTNGFSLVCSQMDISNMLELIRTTNPFGSFSQGQPSVDSYGKYKLTELHYKASTRNLSGNGYHVGSIQGYPISRQKGTVQHTTIKDLVDTAFESLGIPTTTYIQPIMQPGFQDINGVKTYHDPYIKSIQDITNPKLGITFEHSLTIMRSFGRYLDKLKYTNLQPLDLHHTVNGINGDPFINRINVNTSVGYPFNRPKSEFTVPYTYDGDPDAIMFDDMFIREMGKIAQCYRKGVRYNPIFCASLKDEPLKERKKFRTRIFFSCPLAFNLLFRKYYLPIIAFIQSKGFHFFSAVGVNCRSRSWELFQKFLKFPERIIAGDYRAFDKVVDAITLLLAFWMIIDIARRCGYSPDAIKIMQGLAIDCIFSNICIGNSIVVINAQNPSGIPVTVNLNNFVNAVYTGFAFGHIYPMDLFWTEVRKLFYGDDNILSVSPDFPEFTHTFIQKTLERIGVEYTMADKTAESVPYISIEDAEFLKRKFVESNGTVMAPLHISSIYKSLCYRTRLADGVSEIDRDFQALENAKIELIAHDPVIYDKIVEVQQVFLERSDLSFECMSREDIIGQYYPHIG